MTADNYSENERVGWVDRVVIYEVYRKVPGALSSHGQEFQP
jgi:hypothetical protein